MVWDSLIEMEPFWVEATIETVDLMVEWVTRTLEEAGEKIVNCALKVLQAIPARLLLNPPFIETLSDLVLSSN